MRGVISAWSHGGGSFHSPFMPPDTPLEIDRASQLHEILRYMDQHFHGLDSKLPEKILFYYTMGEEREKGKSSFLSDSDELRLAAMLFELIRERKTDFKKPNLHSWAKHIGHMIRLDGRTPDRIEKVMRWAMDDSFWQTNILSTAKLRSKFDQLERKMKGSNPSSFRQQPRVMVN